MVLRFACLSWTLLWLAITQSTFLKFFRCSQFFEFDSKETCLATILTYHQPTRQHLKRRTWQPLASGANGCQMADGRPTHWISIFPNKPWCCILFESLMKQTVMHKLWCGQDRFQVYQVEIQGNSLYSFLQGLWIRRLATVDIRFFALEGSNWWGSPAWISVYRARKVVDERARKGKWRNIVEWLRKRKTCCIVSNDWLSFLSIKESWLKRFSVSYFS